MTCIGGSDQKHPQEKEMQKGKMVVGVDLASSCEKKRDLFKKIRDTKGTFHAKMGSIKDRNVIDLTEAEDIKKRCKNTQKNCTKKSS